MQYVRNHWITAGVLTLIAALVAAIYFWSPRATLRVTTGPPGSTAREFISAFATVSKGEHPLIQFRVVQEPDLAASAKAVEDRKVDLAIVRTDVAPVNGQTIAILRKDAAVFVLPPGSKIEHPSALAGKAVALPADPLEPYNGKLLDMILSYYNLPQGSVKQVALPIAEIGQAARRREVAAAFAVGPVGPGQIASAVQEIARATKGTPTILGFDEADSLVQRFPALQSLDIPQGAFKPRPAVPDDSVTTVAVTYRFVAPATMLNIVAGAIGQSIFNTKAKLVTITPLANEIEAPDTSVSSPILPIHPGVANYLTSGTQSFFDEFQQYIYLGGMLVSLAGSGLAVLIGRWRAKRSEADQNRIIRLIQIADETEKADPAQIDRLDHELDMIAADFLSGPAAESAESTRLSAFSLAISHARHAVERRRRLVGGETPKNENEPEDEAAGV